MSQPIWLCQTEVPSPGLFWAAPNDQTGKYGLTEVTCRPVYFGAGQRGRPFSLVRALQKILDIIIE